MANPETRNDPAVMQAFTDHMHGHYSVYFGVPDPLMDPLYLERMRFLTGLGPLPQPMPPPGAMPGGGPPPEGAPPSDAPASPPDPTAPPSDVGFPENPATGQTWSPTDGGGIISTP